MNDTIKTFDLARRRSVPFVAINTPDQHALIRSLVEHCDKAGENGWRAQIVTWDSAGGLMGSNESGRAWVRKAQDLMAKTAGVDVEQVSAAWGEQPLPKALATTSTMGDDACVIIINAHRWIGDPLVANAVYRTREIAKSKSQMLVLVGPSIELPVELRGDFLVIDDPLPNEDQISKIVDDLHSAASAAVSSDNRPSIVNALRGVSAFAAEQVGALAMTQDAGIDPVAALKMKRDTINATKGLEYVVGGPTFDEIAGLETAVEFGRRVFSGEDAPRLVVLIDEMEKAIGGAQGAQSHEVTKDQLGSLLQTMESWRADGMIAAGVPGSGKTLFAQALGNTFSVPLLRLDLGALKGQYVGQSEQAIRDAMRTIHALSGGRVFFIGTVNRMESLPTELLRRFRFGVWMFDLPSAEERASLWAHYMKANGLGGDIPQAEGWTGAEIRNACEFARRLRLTLPEAMRYVVPIAESSAPMIKALRDGAHGNYLSASYPGKYRSPETATTSNPSDAAPKRRQFKA